MTRRGVNKQPIPLLALETAREQRKQKRQQAFPEIKHSGEADIPLDQAA